MFNNELCPPMHFSNTLPNKLPWSELDWLHDVKGNNFFGLWLRGFDPDLPQGYDNYILSYHSERIHWEWMRKQAENIDGRIIIVNDGLPYDNFDKLPNVDFYTFHSWHFQLQQIHELFPKMPNKQQKHKVSAINNRVTQSKLIIFTAIMELIEDNSLVKLSEWIEPKNVNWWQKTGYPILDQLTDTFRQKYEGKSISIDDFLIKNSTNQSLNSDPFSIAFTDAALHFCLESYHYSYMVDDYGEYIRSGPHLSEKTLKCLLGQTAFIPVSQFDVYNQLQQLGFMFDYGPLDLSFDKDAGNLSRLVKIVELCKTINLYSIEDLIRYTNVSSKHNREHIISEDFGNLCKKQNEQTANTILTDLS